MALKPPTIHNGKPGCPWVLRRIEAKRLTNRQETHTAGARPKHGFRFTATGKKLVRTGWKRFLEPNWADDLDAILRIAEMADADNVDPAEIKEVRGAFQSDKV